MLSVSVIGNRTIFHWRLALRLSLFGNRSRDECLVLRDFIESTKKI